MCDTSSPVPRLCSVQPSAEEHYRHVERGIAQSLHAGQPAITQVQAYPQPLETRLEATLRHGLVSVRHFRGMKKRGWLRQGGGQPMPWWYPKRKTGMGCPHLIGLGIKLPCHLANIVTPAMLDGQECPTALQCHDKWKRMQIHVRCTECLITQTSSPSWCWAGARRSVRGHGQCGHKQGDTCGLFVAVDVAHNRVCRCAKTCHWDTSPSGRRLELESSGQWCEHARRMQSDKSQTLYRIQDYDTDDISAKLRARVSVLETRVSVLEGEKAARMSRVVKAVQEQAAWRQGRYQKQVRPATNINMPALSSACACTWAHLTVVSVSAEFPLKRHMAPNRPPNQTTQSACAGYQSGGLGHCTGGCALLVCSLLDGGAGGRAPSTADTCQPRQGRQQEGPFSKNGMGGLAVNLRNSAERESSPDCV
jgi:hypothetical protein